MPLLANSPSSPWSLAAQPAPPATVASQTRRPRRRQQRALAVPNILLVLRKGFLLVPVGGRLGARGLGGNLGSHGVFSAKKTSVVLVEPGAWLRDLPGKDTAAAAAKGSFWPRNIDRRDFSLGALDPAAGPSLPWQVSQRAGRPCRQLAELRSVRVASAVWRRKCGLIIDPRLLSSNATSDLNSLKRKCRRADFCGRLSPPTRPGSPFQVELLQYAIRSKCLLFCALFTALGRRVINLAQP